MSPSLNNDNLNLSNCSDEYIILLALERLKSRLKRSGDLLSKPDVVAKYLILKLAELEHEVFGILFLDTKNRLVHDETLFRGTLAHTSVYPREVVKEALKHNAGSVVIYHNHPSRDVSPSTADRTITTGLVKALGFVDVRVLDHIIVAGTDYYSFAEKGDL